MMGTHSAFIMFENFHRQLLQRRTIKMTPLGNIPAVDVTSVAMEVASILSGRFSSPDLATITSIVSDTLRVLGTENKVDECE